VNKHFHRVNWHENMAYSDSNNVCWRCGWF